MSRKFSQALNDYSVSLIMPVVLSLLLGALVHSGAKAAPKGRCTPLKGDFVIHQYQLYPENVDFDSGSCLLYTG
jgi:hypothetical protein